MQPLNPVVATDQLVYALHGTFTHAKSVDCLTPRVTTTNRKVDVDLVIVVRFRDGKIAVERIYWDQASVLRQLGLLPETHA